MSALSICSSLSTGCQSRPELNLKQLFSATTWFIITHQIIFEIWCVPMSRLGSLDRQISIFFVSPKRTLEVMEIDRSRNMVPLFGIPFHCLLEPRAVRQYSKNTLKPFYFKNTCYCKYTADIIFGTFLLV